MTLSDKLYKILIQGGSWKTILGGLWVTIQISGLALLLGTLLGAVVCLLRTRRNPVLRGIASVYIAILRGTPVLMLLLLLYYGIFARAGLKPVTGCALRAMQARLAFAASAQKGRSAGSARCANTS